MCRSALFNMEQTDASDPKEYLYKILVVGDIGSGKTSLIKRYVHNVFSLHYKATVRVTEMCAF